jgi:peptidoglycan/xylan/chitin deacetylase (PgdA/CDA1 family)
MMLPILLAAVMAAQAPVATRGRIVWTFDDGPHYRTGKILDLLKCHGVKATFFVLGSMLRKPRGRALLRRTLREGHRVGNHLYTHRNPCQMSARALSWELQKTRRLLDKVSGVVGVDGQRYRPPHGARCHRWLIRRAGYKTIMWHFADIPPVSARRIWWLALTRLRRGQNVIFLFHYDTKRIAAVLRYAAAAGYIGRCRP